MKTQPKFQNLSPNHWKVWDRITDADSSIGHSDINPSVVGSDFWTVDGKRSKIPLKPEYIVGGFYFEHAQYEIEQNLRSPV